MSQCRVDDVAHSLPTRSIVSQSLQFTAKIGNEATALEETSISRACPQYMGRMSYPRSIRYEVENKPHLEELKITWKYSHELQLFTCFGKISGKGPQIANTMHDPIQEFLAANAPYLANCCTFRCTCGGLHKWPVVG